MQKKCQLYFLGAFALAIPALAFSYSGVVIDLSGIGKSGVMVSLQGTSLNATTNASGAWSMSGGATEISKVLRNQHLMLPGGHLVLDENHPCISFSGYDLKGRPLPRSGQALSSETVTGSVARTTSGPDTLLYSWNGKVFLRDTVSVASRSGIVALFDTTANAAIIYGWLPDERDGHLYRTVTIGTQTWMAQNLNYQIDSSWCYDDSSSNCTKYGRLYQWATAMGLDTSYTHTLWQDADSAQHQGLCPNGWRIPSDTEWGTLFAYVGADSAGIRLNSTSGWDTTYYQSLDQFGFDALPAGSRYMGVFCDLGERAHFWSFSQADSSYAMYRHIDYHSVFGGRGQQPVPKKLGLSLRCLHN